MKSIAAYRRLGWRVLATFVGVTIWSWASRYGYIPASESSKPGPWLPQRARLFRNALEVVSARLSGTPLPHDPWAHKCRFAIFCGPSQIGKTKSFLHPIIGYCVDVLRTNCAFLTHKQKQIKAHLRVRLLPMFEQTARLAPYLPATQSLRRERLSGTLWQLEGSNLHALCANVASDLREYSHPVGIMDEPEAYSLNVDGEGDPIELFLDRQKRYQDTSILAGASTPNAVTGHTWQKLCKSSHARLLVECRECGHHQDLDVDRLRPKSLKLTPDEIEAQDAATWHCAWCDASHTSGQVDRMVAQAEKANRWVPGVWAQDDQHPGGHWQPATFRREQADGTVAIEEIGDWEALADPNTGEVLNLKHRLRSWRPVLMERRGWHCTYLHDIDCPNGRFLAHELRARHGTANEWHTHVTGWRAEPVIIAGDMLDTDAIENALETAYRWRQCPFEAKWLLITCDQQGNTHRTLWFPYEVRAVNPGGETWLVDSGVVRGWEGLQELENRQYLVAGKGRRCDRIAVDAANGHLLEDLMAWAHRGYLQLVESGMHPLEARRRCRRILLIGDANLAGDIPWREKTPQKRDRIHQPEGARIFRWNSVHWRDRLHDRLSGNDDRGKFHIPTDDTERPRDFDRWLKSQTSEERVMRQVGAPGGRKRFAIIWQARTYVDTRGNSVERSDTHWKDCSVMGEVLADLVGANPRAGVVVEPGPATSAPAPTHQTPRTRATQNALVTRRKHTRLQNRRRR